MFCEGLGRVDWFTFTIRLNSNESIGDDNTYLKIDNIPPITIPFLFPHATKIGYETC